MISKMIMVVLWLKKIFSQIWAPFRLVSKLFFVSKLIFSIATHQNFFILHIMIDNNDILQIQVVSGGKKN